MKSRVLLLGLAVAAIFPAHAQHFTKPSVVHTEAQPVPQPVEYSELPTSNFSTRISAGPAVQAKGAGTALYTETFGSLPAGWTITTNPGSANGWRWANAAPFGTNNNYPLNGLINSTSKADGWLLYNADTVINTVGTTRPFGGAITSTPIPIGASHTNVMLSFQQFFRFSEGDECYVDVSSNGTSWTAFPIYPNMNLSQFGFLYRNPTITTLNISSVVGGQANAYIRFRFNSVAAQFSFNWLIDDLVIYDADPVDLGITYSGIASVSDPNSGFTSGHSYSSIPLRLADTVFPITYISNYGLGAAGSTKVKAQYFRGTTLLATDSTIVSNVPLAARDSAVVFGSGFKPTAIGDYTIALSINPAADAVLQNDVDTIRFRVTDSVYATYGPEFTERNCYLYRVGSDPSYWGSRFTISNGLTDTITSVSAAFRPNTTVGQRVQAQLYQATGSGSTFSWTPLAISATRTLTAADISTAGNVVTTTFPMRIFTGNINPLILADGDYAIVLTTVTASSDVAVYSMVPPMPTAPSFIGYQGQAGISPNDGTQSFATGAGIATGLVQVPLVHPNFGNARAMLSVKNADRIILGAAYPNPANTTVNIPVGVQATGRAQLNLSSPTGQVLFSQDLGTIKSGTMQLATINTQHLPAGLYFYTLVSEGSKASGRITITH